MAWANYFDQLLFKTRFLGPRCTLAISLVSRLLLPRGLPGVGLIVVAEPVPLFSEAGFGGAGRADVVDDVDDAACFGCAPVPARGLTAVFGF